MAATPMTEPEERPLPGFPLVWGTLNWPTAEEFCDADKHLG
jgi:hypothetical protein